MDFAIRGMSPRVEDLRGGRRSERILFITHYNRDLPQAAQAAGIVDLDNHWTGQK